MPHRAATASASAHLLPRAWFAGPPLAQSSDLVSLLRSVVAEDERVRDNAQSFYRSCAAVSLKCLLGMKRMPPASVQGWNFVDGTGLMPGLSCPTTDVQCIGGPLHAQGTAG